VHPLRSLILAAAGHDAIRRPSVSAPVCRAANASHVCAAAEQCHSVANGAYAKPFAVAYDGRDALLTGDRYPMFATQDPRPVRIVGERARRDDRTPGTPEYQLLFGDRPVERRRVAREGETVRVYVPFGSQWFGCRLAGRPANPTFPTQVSNS
jgi:hypothetical protein